MCLPSSAGSSELLPLCKTLGSEKGSRQSQAWWRRCGEGGESKKNEARGGKGRRERKKIVAEDGGGSLHWRCCDETACKTLGSNWPLGDHVNDDDGHAEEHDEDDCDVDDGEGAMMRLV